MGELTDPTVGRAQHLCKTSLKEDRAGVNGKIFLGHARVESPRGALTADLAPYPLDRLVGVVHPAAPTRIHRAPWIGGGPLCRRAHRCHGCHM